MVHREFLDPVRSGETMYEGKYDGVPDGVSLADDDRWEPWKPTGFDAGLLRWAEEQNVDPLFGASLTPRVPALRAEDV